MNLPAKETVISIEFHLKKVLNANIENSLALLYDHPLYVLIEQHGLIGLRDRERYWLIQLGQCRNPIGAAMIRKQIKKLSYLREAIFGDAAKLTVQSPSQLSIFVAALEAEESSGQSENE